MEIPKEIIDQISSAQEDITIAQNMIDQARAQYPTDNAFQFKMDLAQSALDMRKKRVRQLKTVVSNLSE